MAQHADRSITAAAAGTYQACCYGADAAPKGSRTCGVEAVDVGYL